MGKSSRTIRRAILLSLIAAVLAGCSGRYNVFTESRDERLRRLEEEQTRLTQTNSPVDRTRVQIRISDLLISLMGDAVSDRDMERMNLRVDEYREAILDARDTMLESGREANDSAAGFQDLEIALRQHARQLQDIASRLTFDFRGPIDDLIDEVTEIRNSLLDALFPGRVV